MNKYRFEYIYDQRKDETTIYVWSGQQIIDKRMLPGILTKYMKSKIKKEILKELLEGEE